jgi:hypothetical protein
MTSVQSEGEGATAGSPVHAGGFLGRPRKVDLDNAYTFNRC